MYVLSKTVVAIPVNNEEARIGLCLDALCLQSGDFEILLLLNNCTDGTLEICESFSKRFRNIEIVQCSLSGSLASAGEARRLALEYAARLAGDGVILTTDADAVPNENWVAGNLRALSHGADVVCGTARLDPTDAALIPRALQLDERHEARLLALQDEIATLIDPDPLDPWPRHQQHSGASLAMRAATLRSAGGAPHVATGEDRALIERLQLVDARIRHAPEISVAVSGRLEGRAEGGMAATLKRRMQQRDVLTDERLEPTIDAYRRVLARTRLREVIFNGQDSDVLAEDLLVGAATMRNALGAPYFGAAWADIQRLSPVLTRRRVAFSNLQREISQAVTLRGQLRAELLAPIPSHAGRDNEGNLSNDENAQ